MRELTKPIVTWVSVPGEWWVKGITTRLDGSSVTFSCLDVSPSRSDMLDRIQAGEQVRIMFKSEQHGVTPSIGGTVMSIERGGGTTEVTIAIQEWDRLAVFWDHVLRH